jgi:hypothetical protein
MPSVFREYTLGDKGDMIVRGVGEQGEPDGQEMSVRWTSTSSSDLR